MTVWKLVTSEISHRKAGFIVSLFLVAVAIGASLGALVTMAGYDVRTQQILAAKETALSERLAGMNNDVRKAMLKLGMNLVILPKDQDLGDWYTEDYASRTMPETYVERLANSGIVTVRHFLPSLQQRLLWPEKKRTIILIGSRGEVPNLHMNPVKPMVQPVPPGTIVLGHELHTSLGIQEGDAVTLKGRVFKVHACHARRGNKDDITAWIHLPEAQEILDKAGRINAILALQCNCPGSEIPKIRAEISKILPDTQVVEIASRVVARAEARDKVRKEGWGAIDAERHAREKLRQGREQVASVIVSIVLVGAVVGIGFLAIANVRERRAEIAVLRSLGVKSSRIFAVFLARAVVTGSIGGVLGLVGGIILGRQVGVVLERKIVVAALCFAPFLSMVASWFPAMLAARQDPAEILREE